MPVSKTPLEKSPDPKDSPEDSGSDYDESDEDGKGKNYYKAKYYNDGDQIKSNTESDGIPNPVKRVDAGHVSGSNSQESYSAEYEEPHSVDCYGLGAEYFEPGTFNWFKGANFPSSDGPRSYNKLPSRSKMLRKYRAETHGYS